MGEDQRRLRARWPRVMDGVLERVGGHVLLRRWVNGEGCQQLAARSSHDQRELDVSVCGDVKGRVALRRIHWEPDQIVVELSGPECVPEVTLDDSKRDGDRGPGAVVNRLPADLKHTIVSAEGLKGWERSFQPPYPATRRVRMPSCDKFHAAWTKMDGSSDPDRS